LLPTKAGIYQIHVYLNQVPVTGKLYFFLDSFRRLIKKMNFFLQKLGSPFLIKIDSSKNETKNMSLRSKETISLVDMKKYERETSPINFKLMVRAELTEEEICLNVGKEIKLNSKLLLY
jgi:hypothetical protein